MRERRTISTDLQIRADSDNGAVIGGHSPVWNRFSQNLGGFVEQVAPGATAKTIAEADIRGLLNHDPSLLLGRNRSGTMRLTEDTIGLDFEIDVPDTTVGRDLVVSARRGDITGSSFSFRVVGDGQTWGFTPDDFPLRTLTEIKLYDTGPVTFPAYLDADAGLRSADARALAFAGLVTERRSIDEVLEAAAADQLGEIIRTNDPDEPRDTHSLEVHRARLELARRRAAD